MGATPTQSQKVMKFLRYIMPPLTFGITFWQPAALQLYFFVTTLFAFTQNRILMNPAWRARLGVHPLPPKTPAKGAGTAGVRDQSIVASSNRSGGLTGWEKFRSANRLANEELDTRVAKPLHDATVRGERRPRLRDMIGRNGSVMRGLSQMAEGVTKRVRSEDERGRLSRSARDKAKKYEQHRQKEIRDEKWR